MSSLVIFSTSSLIMYVRRSGSRISFSALFSEISCVRSIVTGVSLDRLVPVHRVLDITTEKPGIEREMALVKVAGTGEKRVEALRLSQVFRAKALDTTHSSFVFEITGAPSKIDAFVELMRPLGLVEVSRTGVAAIARGADAM